MDSGVDTANERGSIAVSIVVPVYNVESYLKECLDDLLAQTLGTIEIICVNDGSTDGSPRILRSYAERDDRIAVFFALVFCLSLFCRFLSFVFFLTPLFFQIQLLYFAVGPIILVHPFACFTHRISPPFPQE